MVITIITIMLCCTHWQSIVERGGFKVFPHCCVFSKKNAASLQGPLLSHVVQEGSETSVHDNISLASPDTIPQSLNAT